MGVAARTSKREFAYEDRHFDFLREIVAKQSGISLTEAKRELVYGRIARRIRALGLEDFDDYCKFLEQRGDEELGNFINAITTNLTSFFREQHHFDFLGKELLPRLKQERGNKPTIKIWCAGCSTGEEPYSVAITARESLPGSESDNVRILATDIDTNVVNTAAAGVYDTSRVEGMPETQVKRWFHRGSGDNEGKVKVRETLQEIIKFMPLNLMDEWPVKGPVDVIFCRNVVIYFDKDTQKGLFDRYADLMTENGYLIIGHSESLFNVCDRFELTGRTIYRKVR